MAQVTKAEMENMDIIEPLRCYLDYEGNRSAKYGDQELYDLDTVKYAQSIYEFFMDVGCKNTEPDQPRGESGIPIAFTHGHYYLQATVHENRKLDLSCWEDVWEPENPDREYVSQFGFGLTEEELKSEVRKLLPREKALSVVT